MAPKHVLDQAQLIHDPDEPSENLLVDSDLINRHAVDNRTSAFDSVQQTTRQALDSDSRTKVVGNLDNDTIFRVIVCDSAFPQTTVNYRENDQLVKQILQSFDDKAHN